MIHSSHVEIIQIYCRGGYYPPVLQNCDNVEKCSERKDLLHGRIISAPTRCYSNKRIEMNMIELISFLLELGTEYSHLMHRFKNFGFLDADLQSQFLAQVVQRALQLVKGAGYRQRFGSEARRSVLRRRI